MYESYSKRKRGFFETNKKIFGFSVFCPPVFRYFSRTAARIRTDYTADRRHCIFHGFPQPASGRGNTSGSGRNGFSGRNARYLYAGDRFRQSRQPELHPVGRGLARAETKAEFTAGADSPNPEPFCPLTRTFPLVGNHPRPTGLFRFSATVSWFLFALCSGGH